MQRINTDSIPLEDLLNRCGFAVEIAKGIKMSFTNGEDSFVLGINGKWGSGKTTLMHYLKEALKFQFPDDKTIFFDFNPWMFSGKDELLFMFFGELSKKLSGTKLKDAIAFLADCFSYLDGVKHLNETAGTIQQTTKEALRKIAGQKSIPDLKAAIDKVMVKEKLRLFVFIDDLDRLTPKEVVDVFQIIKLNANFKNTIFVIAYDKEVVQEILQVHHGFSGERYLEKIVQVDYRLPDPLDEVIQKIFFDKLRAFLKDIKVRYDEIEFLVLWTVYRLKYYFITLRDIYRYFNSLMLRLPAIKSNVDLYQFFVVEAIRVFDYSAYEIIQRNYTKAVMYGPQTNASNLREGITHETTIALYNHLFGEQGDRTVIFPIAEPQYFNRYFALSVSHLDVREELVERFVRDKASRTHILQSAEADGTIPNLLMRLQKRKLDLAAINPLIRWKAETEDQFVQCRHQLISLLGTIIHANNDFAHGVNYLVSIMAGDDGFFNPAKAYLIYYLNTLVYSDEASHFFKHLDVIKNHKAELGKMEEDFLKRYENDHIVFFRHPTRTDFFHTIYLMRYKELFPDQYEPRLENYLDKAANFFTFLRLILRPENSGLEKLDFNRLERLLTPYVMEVLERNSSKMIIGGLSTSHVVLIKAFNKSQDEIKKWLKERQKATS